MTVPYVNPLQQVILLPRIFFGKLMFVDSTYGSNGDGNDGSMMKPFKSINYAMSVATDDRDDCVIVMNGYDNSDATGTNGDSATSITLDKNGVTVLFEGKNNVVVENSTAGGGSIFKIDANQVTLGVLEGGRIQVNAAATAGTTSTVVEIAAAAVDAEVFGLYCSALGNFDEVITVSATSHRADIHDNYMLGDATDTDEGIAVTGTVDQPYIYNNHIITCCATNGGIYFDGIATNVVVKDNMVNSVTASKKGINFAANALGALIRNNVYASADANTVVNGTGMMEFDQHVNDAFTTNSFFNPAVGTVT